MKTPKVEYNSVHVLELRSFYLTLWNKYPELLKYNAKDIYKLLKDTNGYISSCIGNEPDGTLLPAYTGLILPATWGQNSVIDYTTSSKIGKIVRYTNHHTDGYGVLLAYLTEPIKSRFKYGRYWAFSAGKEMRDSIKKGVKENWKKFKNLDSKRGANNMYRQWRKKNYAQEKGQERLQNYNELDI